MEEINVTEKMKKSAFFAKNQYQYKKLIYPESYFISMTMEEEKEELIFHYDMSDKKSFMDIRTEDILTVLAILMNIEKLNEAFQKYNFSMNPENLYYDINRKIYIKVRDIYPDGRGFEQNEFLDNYKALAGFALQKKYTYEDYKKGGKKLLSKNSLQNKIREAVNEELVNLALREEYEQIEKERREKKLLLDKGTFQKMKLGITILSLVCVASIVYLGYQIMKEVPYKNAVIACDNSYIEQDYVGCIDAMRNIEVSEMKIHQKYILANSYIRSENLTQEQKKNILETLSLKEASVRLEYWIYLGRGDTDKAVNIAMQQSDDELLLYAYMKQKAAIETDQVLTGEEKTQQLKDISSKMEPLMEQYDTEEE